MKTDRGFALAALMIFMMVLSIFIAAAVPVYRIQAQREVEEELIFRGQEYVRAIQKYQRRFGIYPSSIEALIDTNGVRFLRRQYKNPITGKPFRLLTINPDGSINGSTVYQQRVVNADVFQGGTPQMFGQPSSSQTVQPQQAVGQKEQQGRDPTEDAGFGRPQSGFVGQAQPLGNSGVVGVAPEGDQPSLKVYNKRERYNEWEFIVMPGFGTVAGAIQGERLPGGQSDQPTGSNAPSVSREVETNPSSPGRRIGSGGD